MNETESDKTIQNALEEINPEFYKWLKKIFLCNKTRAVSLCTFLVNFNININYFPWHKVLHKEIPDLIPEELKKEFVGFTFASEIIFGIIILVVLRHAHQQKASIQETDEIINKLWLSGPLINQFFIFNTISPKNRNVKLSDLLEIFPNFNIKDNMLPKLEFDPEFQNVMENEAVKQLYDTNFITDWLDSRESKPYKYFPDRGTFFKNLQVFRDKKTKIFDVNPNLSISKFMFRNLNVFPNAFFSSTAQIDEIMSVFIEYYSKKIPSKKEEIIIFLSCFGELIKLMKGKLYNKFRYGYLVKKLKLIVSKEKTFQFLNKFCLYQRNLTFLSKDQQFNSRKFVFDYHNFLSFAAYRISGFIYTGIFLIWRAMIKYLETLQNKDEFRIGKGSLLENWCYYKAIEFGFQPEKIVLINQDKPLSPYYDVMKNQTKDFPQPAIEISVKFPHNYKPSFHEIDLAIKVEEYIFIFECKTTSHPIGEIGNYIKWLDKFGFNIQLLINKGDILLHNIANRTLNHPYLQGLKKYVPIIIQTEGIISKFLGMDTSGYLNFLKVLRKNIDNKTIQEFFKNNFKNSNDNSP